MGRPTVVNRYPTRLHQFKANNCTTRLVSNSDFRQNPKRTKLYDQTHQRTRVRCMIRSKLVLRHPGTCSPVRHFRPQIPTVVRTAYTMNSCHVVHTDTQSGVLKLNHFELILGHLCLYISWLNVCRHLTKSWRHLMTYRTKSVFFRCTKSPILCTRTTALRKMYYDDDMRYSALFGCV